MARATSSLPVPVSPGDKHGDVQLRCPPEQAVERAHGGTFADDVLEAEDAIQLAPQRVRLLLEPLTLQRPGHHEPHFVRIEGLGEVVVGSLLDGLHRLGDGGVGGHEDDLGVGRVLLDGLEDLEAVRPRHANVRQHHIEALGLDEGERTAAILGGRHAVSVTENAGDQLEHVLLVVSDENARLIHLRAPRKKEGELGAALGMGARLDAAAVGLSDGLGDSQPQPRAMSLAVKKGSKSRSRASGGRPGPLSRTVSASAWSSVWMATITRPLAPAASTAFFTRLVST